MDPRKNFLESFGFEKKFLEGLSDDKIMVLYQESFRYVSGCIFRDLPDDKVKTIGEYLDKESPQRAFECIPNFFDLVKTYGKDYFNLCQKT